MGLGSDMREWQEQVAWLICTNGLTEATLQILKSLSEPLASLSAGYLGQIYQFSCRLSSDPCTLGSRVVFTVSQVFHFPASSLWKPQLKNTFALDNSYCICKTFSCSCYHSPNIWSWLGGGEGKFRGESTYFLLLDV